MSITIKQFSLRTGRTVRSTRFQRVAPTEGRPARFRTVGAIPNSQDWRPATEADRDAMVQTLNAMTFEDDEVGDWRATITVGNAASVVWSIDGTTRREAMRMAEVAGRELARQFALEGDVMVTVGHAARGGRDE